VKNRKLLVLLGPIFVLVMFAGVIKTASWLMSREYRDTYRAPAATVDQTPRAAGLADEAAAAARKADAKPYAEAEYRTFGNTYGIGGVAGDVREQMAAMPDTVETIIAELLVNLAEAVHWRELAFRNCDREDMLAAFAIRDLAQTQGDGQVYYPELDDIASTIDWASLHYAALKTVAAAEKAERALLPLVNEIPADVEMEIATPYGKIAVFSPVFERDRLPHPFFSSIRAKLPD
jgi:hypothetical protein